jgi:hypothetical protein
MLYTIWRAIKVCVKDWMNKKLMKKQVFPSPFLQHFFNIFFQALQWLNNWSTTKPIDFNSVHPIHIVWFTNQQKSCFNCDSQKNYNIFLCKGLSKKIENYSFWIHLKLGCYFFNKGL